MSLYIVLTDKPYGGGSKAQAFFHKKEAEEYRHQLLQRYSEQKQDVDVIVLEQPAQRNIVAERKRSTVPVPASSGDDARAEERQMVPAALIGHTVGEDSKIVICYHSDWNQLDVI